MRLDQALALEAFRAAEVVRDAIRQTPVQQSQWLSQQAGCSVQLKLDNEQVRQLRPAARAPAPAGQSQQLRR